MAQFNFTVRATDSEGSFADRSFNITVRNSKIERYMAINTTDAYTSSDGTTWTLRPGMGGYSCAYGNGFWLINCSDGIRKSYDGVNYNLIPTTSIQAYDSTGTPIASASQGLAAFTSTSSCKMKSFNNKFYLPYQGNVGGTSQIGVFVSSDGITWNFKSVLIVSVSGPLLNFILSISEDNGTLFLNYPWSNGTQKLGYMSINSGETWTEMADVSGNIHNSGVLKRFNGLYLQATGDSGNSYKYSTDGSNWTSGSFGSISNVRFWDFIYANGKLYAFFNKSTTAGQAQLYLTSTDGINWVTNTYKSFISSTQLSVGSNVIPVYKNGIFVIGGSSGQGNDDTTSIVAPSGGLRLSTNGVDWVTVNRYSDTSTQFTDVAMM